MTTLTGAAIDPTLTYTSPEVNFEMDGALPKIVVGAYGVKHLNRVIAGVKAEQVNNLKIKNNNGLVSITSEIPENITIYTILGARVAEYFKVKEIEIPLSTGTYIIRSLSTNTKLLIK